MKSNASGPQQSSNAIAHQTGNGSGQAVGFPSVAQFLGGKKSLGISAPAQAQTNWCWAACCSVIVGQLQQDLATQFVGGKNDTFDALNVLTTYGKHGGTYAKKIPWDTLVTEIDNDRPVVLLFGPSKNAHYVLMVGYDGSSNRDKNRKYILSDPQQKGGAHQALSPDEFENYRGNFLGYYTTT